MDIVTTVATLLAALIIVGIAVLMYLDVPIDPQAPAAPAPGLEPRRRAS